VANNTRDLRRQIRSVRNTAQLTRAMKMVASAKLRRAQDAMLAARPYSEAMRRVLADVALRARPELNPLLAVRPIKTIDLFVVTSDKGLAGAFNANIMRAADQWMRARADEGATVRLTIVGRKAIEYYKRRPQVKVLRAMQDVKNPTFTLAQELAADVEQRFIDGETDAVFMAYNQFRSLVSQKVVVEPLLPLAQLTGQELESFRPEGTEFLYEPAPEQLLGALLSRFVAFGLFHPMLESTAAEHAARMAAMDNATNNANEMISKLTLLMNRIRQAAITKEIIEVVSGAEALG
jgi:F-type H+-transporting ATPase subunit gamma